MKVLWTVLSKAEELAQVWPLSHSFSSLLLFKFWINMGNKSSTGWDFDRTIVKFHWIGKISIPDDEPCPEVCSTFGLLTGCKSGMLKFPFSTVNSWGPNREKKKVQFSAQNDHQVSKYVLSSCCTYVMAALENGVFFNRP